jgi:hypothetical protein
MVLKVVVLKGRDFSRAKTAVAALRLLGAEGIFLPHDRLFSILFLAPGLLFVGAIIIFLQLVNLDPIATSIPIFVLASSLERSPFIIHIPALAIMES